jgi:hypothetical protein
MKKSISQIVILAIVLATLSIQGTAQAALGPIQGSFAWGIFGNINSINNHTFILPQPPAFLSGAFVNIGGTGNFSIVPDFTKPTVDFSKATWLSSSTLDVANPAGWTLGSAAFGTWVTNSGSYTLSNGFLNANLNGTFTPGTMFTGLSQSNASMTLGFIMNGNTASNVSGSVAMAATPTPIPAAAWLLGSGLLGLIGIRRKHSV